MKIWYMYNMSLSFPIIKCTYLFIREREIHLYFVCHHLPITVDFCSCFLQIWNLNMMRDRFMAMCTIKMSERSKFDGHHVFRYELFGKDKEASVQKPGTLWLRLLHTTDMTKV